MGVEFNLRIPLTMKKLLLTAAMITFLPFGATAQEMVPPSELPAGNYSLDKTHASLIWKVSHTGLSNYTARFTDFDADINYNPENPEASAVSVTINPLSLETDYPNEEEKDFDKKLSEGEEWLNGTAFPEITFTSTKISMNEDSKTGKMRGDLTFLGVTKPVTLDVTFNGAYLENPFAGVPAMGFSATGMIDRSEWGFDTYEPAIGGDVSILIETEFHKDPES